MQGFPTINAFVNGRMVDYNGDRSAGSLKDWAISLIPNRVTHLPSPEKLQGFLQRCGGSSGGDAKGKTAKDGTAWGGCVVLFSDKKQTSPLYKSLAAQHAGKLAFGEVRAAARCLRAWPCQVATHALPTHTGPAICMSYHCT